MRKVKKHRLLVYMLIALIGISGNGLAQTNKGSETMEHTLHLLYTAKDSGAREMLFSRLNKLAASNKEQDMIIAANYFFQLKEKKTSDSIESAIKVKFPLGFTVRNIEEDAVFQEKDLAKKVKLYYGWIKKFPPAKFPDINHDHIVYDYARSAIANDYAEKGNVAKAVFWISKCEEDFWKGNAYGGLGETFHKVGNLPMAALYTKKAMLSAEKYYYSKSQDNAVRFAGSGYIGLMSSYIKILIEEKKYAEALVWTKKALTLQKDPNPSLAFSYAILLKRLHHYQEAFKTLEGIIKEGHATPEMVDTFKVLYVKIKGSDAGYDAYAEAIHKGFLENLHKKLIKEEIDLPAPGFTLADINGKAVSLANYRGKTVVLDFWATWCGPCKASFPSMEKLVDKYKSDTTVKFLFIHTWERDSTAALATAGAKTFIDSHHYPFEVLMDLKDPNTGENRVVESYKVSGIPTKFVIDKNGMIRFRFTGFYGGDQGAVDEVSAMIRMAQKGTNG